MSRSEFLDWVQRQEARYEFDGSAPVAMTGLSVNHNRIVRNIHWALRERLEGDACEASGPDDGLATIGEATLFPDVMISCTKPEGKSVLTGEDVLRLSGPDLAIPVAELHENVGS